MFNHISASSGRPTLCGDFLGEHIYLEADTVTSFTITTGGGGSARWSIFASQIEASATTLPPFGCMIFLKGMTGTFNSYNFQGGFHLNNQNYRYHGQFYYFIL